MSQMLLIDYETKPEITGFGGYPVDPEVVGEVLTDAPDDEELFEVLAARLAAL